MSYQIGDCLLDRSGTLTIPDTVDSHTARALLTYLTEHGYEGEPKETIDRLTINTLSADRTIAEHKMDTPVSASKATDGWDRSSGQKTSKYRCGPCGLQYVHRQRQSQYEIAEEGVHLSQNQEQKFLLIVRPLEITQGIW